MSRPSDMRSVLDPKGVLKMWEWKKWEWKYRQDPAGVENAGVQISGVKESAEYAFPEFYTLMPRKATQLC